VVVEEEAATALRVVVEEEVAAEVGLQAEEAVAAVAGTRAEAEGTGKNFREHQFLPKGPGPVQRGLGPIFELRQKFT